MNLKYIKRAQEALSERIQQLKNYGGFSPDWHKSIEKPNKHLIKLIEAAVKRGGYSPNAPCFEEVEEDMLSLYNTLATSKERMVILWRGIWEDYDEPDFEKGLEIIEPYISDLRWSVVQYIAAGNRELERIRVEQDVIMLARSLEEEDQKGSK